METLQQTSFNLRNAAIQNITDYCNKNNCQNDFSIIKYEIIKQADECNTSLPIDFYIKFYNLTIELLK
jgi:hypothetical protein